MAREEYATLDELKSMIEMDGAVVDRNDLLTIALDAAHEAMESTTGRRFDLAVSSARTYRVVDRCVMDEDGELLVIDDAGAAPTLVEVGAGTSFTTLGSTIEYDPENAVALGRPIRGLRLYGGSWSSSPLSRVRVTAQWGWPAVPARVKEATLLQANRLYARRKSPQGVVGTAEWGEVRLSKLDADVQSLVADLILSGF